MDYFKKLLLFLYIVPSAYAMDYYNPLQKDNKFFKTIRKAKDNKFSQQVDCDAIKKYIDDGADPNIIVDGRTLVGLAANFLNNDLLRYLIQHNADINQKDNFGCSPLRYVIGRRNGDKEKNLAIIMELCSAGASLVLDRQATVFHYLTTIKDPKEDIEAIMIYAHFDLNNKEQNVHILDKETVITVLCACNRLNYDKPIQLAILSHLASSYPLSGFNKKLCKMLFENNNKNHLLVHMYKRVKNINETLQVKDDKRTTALEWWNEYVRGAHLLNSSEYQSICSLLDGTRLEQDMNVFSEASELKLLLPDNLILRMFNNS